MTGFATEQLVVDHIVNCGLDVCRAKVAIMT
jgi:hypothetical protein